MPRRADEIAVLVKGTAREPCPSTTVMTADEKAGKTLEELGVRDAEGVQALFAEVRSVMERERGELISTEAPDESERDRRAKVLRDRWLARRSGILTAIDQHWLKPSKSLKPVVGRQFNELRRAARELEFEQLVKAVPIARTATGRADVLDLDEARLPPDLTLPGYQRPPGSIHPITRVQREIEDIFLNLGFTVETGPEVETVYYNFEALNIPEDHPARDDMDSLYVDSETVLRTHTSPVQIRTMQRHGAPLHIIAPGKVYRRDNPDATHSPMFHQIEGLAVDTDITFADLKGTLDFFAKKFFGETVRTRFQPTFFPFTEPSGEVAVSCMVCEGRGCRLCKESGWIELMGCGMVHPEVLRNVGIDPDRYAGWAFGLGVDRFAMTKYGINDIQLFFQNDVRFLEQF